MLMLTHSAAFRHDYLPVASQSIKELGENSGMYEAVATEDCEMITEAKLRDFSAILFATTGELPLNNEQKTALLDFVRNGNAFVGIHNAADTFYKFPEYGEMLGGYFNGHPWTQEIAVIVEDPSHPSARHLPMKFVTKEEVYTFRNWQRDKTHVLLSLDNSSVDLGKGTREDNDYALCWCHNYGKGRVFYTAFGHFKEIWGQEWLRKHLLEGIVWSMGSQTK